MPGTGQDRNTSLLTASNGTQRSTDRLKRFIPIIAGTIALAVYVSTLAPTVTSEDSGELIGAAHFFGVAHPPGYPVWTILCGLFLRVFPLGAVAWRANLFSGVCTAIGIGVLCRTLTLLKLTPWVACAGALICAFGAVLWSQSVIAEVYTLHFLIFTLLVWCVVRWREHEDGRWLCLASVLAGIGMGNHQTIGFTCVATAAWVLLQRPRLLRNWRLVIASILAFAVGLLPHLYIYARAQAEPAVNWGHATTLKAVWDHVSRRQYKSSTPSSKGYFESVCWEDTKGRLSLVAGYCIREFTPALAALGVVGLGVMALRRHRHALLLWLLLVGCNVGIFMAMRGFGYRTRQDQWTNQVFFLPVYASVAMAIAFGLGGLLGIVRRLLRCCPRFPARLNAPFAACMLMAAAAVPAVANYNRNNLRHYWYAYDHAKSILDTMLPNAIIFPSGDHNTFPLLYLVLVEGYRSDVIIADKYGYIDLHLYADMPDNPGKPRTRTDRDRIEEWVIRSARRPVYYTVKRPSLVPNAEQVHVGVLYHLLPNGKPFDKDSIWAKYRYRNEEGAYAPRDFGADNIMADWEYFQGVHELERADRQKALHHFTRCVESAWGIKEVCNNVGSALAEHGFIDDAISYYRKAADMSPDYEAPRWNLVRIYKSRREFELAAGVFEELTRSHPDDFRPWGELGFLAARSGDKDNVAVEYWRRSLALNPAQPQIIEQLHHFYSGAKDDKAAPETTAIAKGPAGSQPAEGSGVMVVDKREASGSNASRVSSRPADVQTDAVVEAEVTPPPNTPATTTRPTGVDAATAGKAPSKGRLSGRRAASQPAAVALNEALSHDTSALPQAASQPGEASRAPDGQESIAGGAGLSVATPQPAGLPVLGLGELGHDLGKVPPNYEVRHVFSFQNLGAQALTIGKITSSCGCTVAKLDKNEFAPGEIGRLQVSVRTPRRRKHFSQSIRLQTNDPNHPEVKLTVDGTVVDPLRADPSGVEFNGVPSGSEDHAQVEISSVYERPFTIAETNSTLEEVTVRKPPAASQPAPVQTVELMLGQARPAQLRSGRVQVKTSLGDVTVPVRITVPKQRSAGAAVDRTAAQMRTTGEHEGG